MAFIAPCPPLRRTGQWNLTMGQTLAKIVTPIETDWPDYLPETQVPYNTGIHEATGSTPFQVILKQHVRTGDDSLADELHPTPARNPALTRQTLTLFTRPSPPTSYTPRLPARCDTTQRLTTSHTLRKTGCG